MRMPWHPFLVLILVLATMVGSIQEAVARSIAADRLTQITICANGGVMVISLDADGMQVDPADISSGKGYQAKHCPDCLLIVAIDLPAAVTSPQFPRSFVRTTVSIARLLPAPLRVGLWQPARGPPTKV